MSRGVLCVHSVHGHSGKRVSSKMLIQRLVYTFHCLSANSELEKDGHTALNTHSVSPSEKIKQYQAGQTVTCFLKKVSSTHFAMPSFSQKKRRSWRWAVSTRL